MRFKEKDAISFPKQMTLGAIDDNNLIYEMGEEIAAQLKTIGAHVNFAPVVDVNNNPANPVIHNRSFGEDKFNVATKAYAYMKGMQDAGILACAKHFPGHGDTDVDSHYDLPVINHNFDRLQSTELMPFRVLTQLGVGSIMTAHLFVPAIDDWQNRPTSLSVKAIKDLLINDMGFKGLIFTDGLEMHGVAKHFEPGHMEVEALFAGNDILLLPIDIDKAVVSIKEALDEGVLKIADIDLKVAKILKAKHQLGLDKRPVISNLSGIPKNVNNHSAKAIKTKLYEKAITLVKDQNNTLPINNSASLKIASLSVGSLSKTSFQKRLDSFGAISHFNIGKKFGDGEKKALLQKLAPYDLVLIGLHDMSIYASKDYGLGPDVYNLLFALDTQNKTVVNVFGTPYALKNLQSLPNLVMAYEDDPMMQDLSAQAIFGSIGYEGELPVSIQPFFESGSGIKRAGFNRLGFATPESVGIDSDTLLLIDSIVEKMIKTEAAPGCQIMGVKDGKIFFNKAYGKHDYKGSQKVELNDIYDVASVTKILSTSLAMMKLYEQGEINLLNPLKSYLPDIDTSNKGDLIIEDVLAHHAGLPAWIPFYINTVETKNKKVSPKYEYYRSIASDSFNLPVAKDLYLRYDMEDSIRHRIYGCSMREKRDYRYSDLGFYIFKDIIERKTLMPLDQYMDQAFYQPMGLKKTGFNPLNRIDPASIVPSEKDKYFRNQIVKGYVHDMGAAMLGGVAGHAGLFSNSIELAALMQMLLNGGSYNGIQFLLPETVEKFTKRFPRSTRRALGFDMKELNEDKKLNMSELASASTFGHLGFTGASVFADPEKNFIYIFISNRTFPTMENRKFGRENYRPKIQSVFYQAMKNVN